LPFIALLFDADGDAADSWADALLAAGALSVDVTDPRAGTADEAPLYGEPGEPVAGLWPLTRIMALFGDGVDAADALAAAGRALQRPPPPHECSAVADQDWVRATQAQFAPIRITPRLWIVPSWCEAPDPGAINLTLDPGLAFGTGSHPTTRLCLAWLAASLAGGERVLDYGCGSGILAIAALKLGAREAVGVDVDPQALVASRANAQRNRVAASFTLPDAQPSSGTDTFDVIVANILANPLVLLAPVLAARARCGGRIVLSGVLAEQADAVCGAYARWFKIARWQGDDGWVALVGERVADAPGSR